MEIEMKYVLAILLFSATPAFAFDKRDAVDRLLSTAHEFAPEADITREMLEKLSPMQLRMFTMTDCQGANKKASFEVTNGRIVSYTAEC